MNLKQQKIKSTKPSKFNKPEKPLDLARREDMIRQAAERYQPRNQASLCHLPGDTHGKREKTTTNTA